MHQITIALAAFCVAVVRVNSTCHGCHTPICGENEVPVRGHPRRDKFCRPAYTPREVFRRLRRCVCKPTYVRNSWDECVPRKLCRRCKCRLQKDWHMCSSACPVTYNMTMPLCSRMCVPGCDCPPGWVVDSKNWKRCVKAKKFPPICPPHSTFQPCVSNCLPRCGIIAPKTCVSSCHRGACVCDEGYAEFWGYHGRVCVRQERCEWHLRNLLILIRAGSNGAGAGLPGGVIHPGGWVIGPWGAFLPSVLGLPASAGINGGSAFLTGMNTAGRAHSSARGGATPMTGAVGSISAASGAVGAGTHGTEMSMPAGALPTTGPPPFGAAGNERGGTTAIHMGGPSGANTGGGNAADSMRRGGAPFGMVTPSASAGNGVHGTGIGLAGGNLGSTVGVGGSGVRLGGGSAPLSASTVSGVTGSGRGSSGVGVIGGSLGNTARIGSAGVSMSGTAPSLATGTSTGALGTGLVTAHRAGAAIAHPAATVTNAVDAAGTSRGMVGLSAESATLRGGSEFHGPGIRSNTTPLLRNGVAFGGSGGSGSAPYSLGSGARVGGPSVGVNVVDSSNNAGLVASGSGLNVGSAILNASAETGGRRVGGNGAVSSSDVSVTTRGESFSGGGRVGVNGGAASREGASLRGGAGVPGARATANNAGGPLVTMAAGGHRFSSGVTGVRTSGAEAIATDAAASTAATALAPNIPVNNLGMGEGHSVLTSSSSSTGLGGGVAGSPRRGVVADTPGATSTINVIGTGSTSSHAAERNGAVAGTNAAVTPLHTNVAHGAHSGSTATSSILGTGGRHSMISVTSNGSNFPMSAGGAHSRETETNGGGFAPGTLAVTSVHGNGILGGDSALSTASGSIRRESTGSSVLVTSGGSGGSAGSGSIHSRGAAAHGAVSSAMNRVGIESVSPNGGAGVGVISSGGNHVSPSPGSVRFSETPLTSGANLTLSPGMTATSGLTGHGRAGASGGFVSAGPVNIIYPARTGSGGTNNGVARAITATSAASGVGATGGSESTIGGGPFVTVSPATITRGLNAAGTSSGTRIEVVGTNPVTNAVSGTGNTGVTGGTSANGLTIHVGYPASTRIIGAPSGSVASISGDIREGGLGGPNTASIVLQPGGSNSGVTVYGIPPIITLNSNAASAGLSNAPTVSSLSSRLSVPNTERVDTGEASPTTTGLASTN